VSLESCNTYGIFFSIIFIFWSNRAIHHNLGNIYEKLDMLDSALHYRQLRYDEAKESKTAVDFGLATSGFASTFLKLNKLDSSLYYSKQCISYGIKAGRYDFVRGSRLLIAQIFHKKGFLDSALYYGNEVFKAYKSVPDTSNMIITTLLLSDVYNTRKQYDSAYKYLSLYSSLKKNFSEEEKVKKVQTILFDDIARQQRLEQQSKNEQQQYETRVKIYSLIGGLAVLLTISLILYGNNKQKQKSKNEIERAYHDLKSTQAQLIQSEKMAYLAN